MDSTPSSVGADVIDWRPNRGPSDAMACRQRHLLCGRAHGSSSEGSDPVPDVNVRLAEVRSAGRYLRLLRHMANVEESVEGTPIPAVTLTPIDGGDNSAPVPAEGLGQFL